MKQANRPSSNKSMPLSDAQYAQASLELIQRWRRKVGAGMVAASVPVAPMAQLRAVEAGPCANQVLTSLSYPTAA